MINKLICAIAIIFVMAGSLSANEFDVPDFGPPAPDIEFNVPEFGPVADEEDDSDFEEAFAGMPVLGQQICVGDVCLPAPTNQVRPFQMMPNETVVQSGKTIVASPSVVYQVQPSFMSSQPYSTYQTFTTTAEVCPVCGRVMNGNGAMFGNDSGMSYSRGIGNGRLLQRLRDRRQRNRAAPLFPALWGM